VQVLFRYPMDLGLHPSEPVDAVQCLTFDAVRDLGVLDGAPQRRHGALGALTHLDEHPGSTHVTTRFAAHLNRDLATQVHGLDGGIEHRAVAAAIDQRTQRHVS